MGSPINTLKRYPVATGAGIVALALGGVFIARGNAVPALELRESELVSQVSLIENNAQNATGLANHLKSIETTLEEVDSRLFDREEVAINTNFFYDLDEDLGAQVRSVSQSADPAAQGSNANKGLKSYTIITYNLSVAGTYPELVEFLGVIDSVKAFARVSDFEIKGGSSGAGGGNLVLNVKVEVLGSLES